MGQIGIVVTPLTRSGKRVDCEIGPKTSADQTFVQNGVIRLPPGAGAVDLCFELRPGAGPLALSWASNGGADPAFSSKKGGRCPRLLDKEAADFDTPVLAAATQVLTVKAHSAPSERKIHYSLNFVDAAGQPCRCDPIFINGITPPPPLTPDGT